METTDPRATLRALESGLNFRDTEDRAIFRQRVEHMTRNMTLSGIRAMIREALDSDPSGPRRVGHSRSDAIRELSLGWIIQRRVKDAPHTNK